MGGEILIKRDIVEWVSKLENKKFANVMSYQVAESGCYKERVYFR